MAQELEEYRRKRDFSRTTEPSPQAAAGEGPLSFVVQKHHARQLHYDFRLELNGVLKSWSVPKGPSLNPEDKRLAVMVEDHPLDYAGFEGIIPRGEYGAGEVIVWDNGTYSPDESGQLPFNDRAVAEARLNEGLEKGKLAFTLRGHKLKGSWTLVKIQKSEKDWLLIKHQDDYASPDRDILKEAESVISDRTIEEVKAGQQPRTPVFSMIPKEVPGSLLAPIPQRLTPMLASLAATPFSHPDWIFEPKLDGYRIIAHIQNGRVSLLSRNNNVVTRQYSALVPDLSRQPVAELILDGEIIAMDENGRQCFQCLQDYLKALRGSKGDQADKFPLIYYVFDILYLDGYDLRSVPLRARKELLQAILRPTAQVRLVDYFERDGETVYQAAIKNGLEGVIAKRADSLYEAGRRSPNWLKIKGTQSDEFVIGGYSVAEGGRAKTFSSLLLGYFDDKNRLVFAGHVGSGFDERTLTELKNRLDALRTDDCPFSEEPPLNAPTTWVRPELVAEVKFSEWTNDGHLRIPVFLRLREDKLPADVRRTEATGPPKPLPESENNELRYVIQQLENQRDSFTIEVAGNKIKLSNVDKVLWPATEAHPAVTKRHLLSYLAEVSVYLLPHLKDRPLTLSRYPDGILGEHFWQKHWGHPTPDFVSKVNISEEKGTRSEYLVCNNLATLLWLGQVADIEFHTWYSRIVPQPDLPDNKLDADSILDYPDFIVFDLDPYIYSGQEASGEEPELNRKGFDKTCEAAWWLKDALDELSLNAFVKTSGKTGLHLYVPIIRNLDYRAVRSAAQTIARFLVQKHPKDITMEWAQEKRKGKVFVDYGQNVRGKTLASVYSPRPAAGATVSAPLRWEEVGKVYPTDFSITSLPDRLKDTGDLWGEILSAKRDLKNVLS